MSMSGTERAPERMPTGVPGLDSILKGGVLRGGIYIVQGVPGSGKTILGNQICFNQAAHGGRALYVTLLAETHSRMLAHIGQLGFFEQDAVPDRVAYIGAFRTLEESGMRGLLDLIRQEIRARQASVVVLDGLATVGESASSDLELKKFVHELQTQAVFAHCTMFLLTSGIKAPLSISPEYTMVDGLIELKTRMFGHSAQRELQVHKLRGSDYVSGEHAFRIADSGVVVFPRVEAVLADPSRCDRADGDKVSTGNATLDHMMGGGPDRHSVTVVLGPAGSGKTTVGMQFLGAVERDEPALLFGFHENPTALRIKSSALKLRLNELIEQGRLEVMWQPSTEGSVDEVCHRLLDALRARKVRRLFLDGIEGFERLGFDRSRLENLASALCNELRGLSVTSFITAETALSGIVPGQTLAGLALEGLSPIAENILVLRLAAVRAEIHRLIGVIKARDSRIDMRLRRFEIVEGGLSIEQDFGTADAVLRELSQQAHGLSARSAGESLGGG